MTNFLSQVIMVIAESPMFEFVSPNGGEFPLANVRKVYVTSQNITTVLFPIRATVLGEIAFSVKATSIYTSDLVFKTVLVKVIFTLKFLTVSINTSFIEGVWSLSGCWMNFFCFLSAGGNGAVVHSNAVSGVSIKSENFVQMDGVHVSSRRGSRQSEGQCVRCGSVSHIIVWIVLLKTH